MRNGIVAVSLLMLAGTALSGTTEDDPSPWVERSFVIMNSTPSYAEAMSILKAAAVRLDAKVDLRELTSDDKRGLTFPKDLCQEEWGEFPCYFPRGRWDDGVYLSIEHSSGYKGFTPGLYIVVFASGSKESEEVRAALSRARQVYPDAYVKTTLVYLGCMH